MIDVMNNNGKMPVTLRNKLESLEGEVIERMFHTDLGKREARNEEGIRVGIGCINVPKDERRRSK